MMCPSPLNLIQLLTYNPEEPRHWCSLRVVGVWTPCGNSSYAISAEKEVSHPAVFAIADDARRKLFG